MSHETYFIYIMTGKKTSYCILSVLEKKGLISFYTTINDAIFWLWSTILAPRALVLVTCAK